MLKSLGGIAGALLLATTSLAPAKADVKAPEKLDGVRVTIAKEGQLAVTFVLLDCEVRMRSGLKSTITSDVETGVHTVKGDATISALRDEKQVFLMSVTNAVVTLEMNPKG